MSGPHSQKHGAEPPAPKRSPPARKLVTVGLVLVVALGTTYIPTFEGLAKDARHALFILLLSAGLWVTEAIPAFAVSLVVFALQLLLLAGLGRHGKPYAGYLAPWANPLVWLFLGGFTISHAAARTRLDRAMADVVLRRFGATRHGLLFGTMLVLALLLAYTVAPLSNVMSNTTAANVLVPIAIELGRGHEAIAAVPVAIAASAAMCLPISTPANAQAFATGKIAARDFLVPGIVLTLVTPPLVVAWASVVLRCGTRSARDPLRLLATSPQLRLAAVDRGDRGLHHGFAPLHHDCALVSTNQDGRGERGVVDAVGRGVLERRALASWRCSPCGRGARTKPGPGRSSPRARRSRASRPRRPPHRTSPGRSPSAPSERSRVGGSRGTPWTRSGSRRGSSCGS